MMVDYGFHDEPCYVISVAARMVGVHAQTLRYYERVGLVEPSRSMGKQRLYSPRDIELLRRIKALTDEMGVNLAGVEVVLKLMNRVNQLEAQVKDLAAEVDRLGESRQSYRREQA
ncbi:MAG: helix-turn-helix transcriptional regulator [Dehalococcoidia bacterium]|nr:helix-turn-helix transcriptional regulator [Dehalococcoidia bacterium]